MNKAKQPIDIPRVCVTCEYWVFEEGEPGYSEYTPGSNAAMYCRKGYWDFSFGVPTAKSYKETVLTALTCKDYDIALIEPQEETVND